jgi:hypothetical protein
MTQLTFGERKIPVTGRHTLPALQWGESEAMHRPADASKARGWKRGLAEKRLLAAFTRVLRYRPMDVAMVIGPHAVGADLRPAEARQNSAKVATHQFATSVCTSRR